MPTTPHPSDAATIDAILNALYDVLSGPAGQPRDWDRLRSLFLPDARIIPVVSTPGEPARARLLTIEDFIRRLEPIFATENFWERESSRETKTYGQIAHVLSSYDYLRDPTAAPFDQGANSIQLFNDKSRWWIVSIMWNTPRSA
ncbi:MAG: hypothetical protein WCC32_01440 [Terriglobales bacterium]